MRFEHTANMGWLPLQRTLQSAHGTRTLAAWQAYGASVESDGLRRATAEAGPFNRDAVANSRRGLPALVSLGSEETIRMLRVLACLGQNPPQPAAHDGPLRMLPILCGLTQA